MVNFAKSLVAKAWKLVLGFFGVLRRAMCCFRKRRRASDVGLPVYLTAHDGKMCTVQHSGDDLQSWDAWNEDDVPVVVGVDSAGNIVDLNQTATASAQRHSMSASSIGSSNGRLSPPASRGSGDQRRESQSDDDMDFFKDMAPTNIRQKKYVPRPEDSLGAVPSGLSSRLKLDTRAVLPYHGADLGVLEDDVGGAEESWEDQAELEVDSAIREKRQVERERRIAEHQRRKLEKEMQRGRGGGHAPATGAAYINSLPPQQQPLPPNARRKVY